MAMPEDTSEQARLLSRRKHLRNLCLISAVALAPRLLMLSTAVAPARDSFRYLAAARALQDLPFTEAVPALDVHPLYPMTLLAAKQLLTFLTGMDGPYAWLRAGQLWSLACYLAFLGCAYVAGVGLWSPRTACLGCMALAIVPRQVCYSVDVLSDSLHAALWMACFACLVWTWRRPRVVETDCCCSVRRAHVLDTDRSCIAAADLSLRFGHNTIADDLGRMAKKEVRSRARRVGSRRLAMVLAPRSRYRNGLLRSLCPFGMGIRGACRQALTAELCQCSVRPSDPGRAAHRLQWACRTLDRGTVAAVCGGGGTGKQEPSLSSQGQEA